MIKIKKMLFLVPAGLACLGAASCNKNNETTVESTEDTVLASLIQETEFKKFTLVRNIKSTEINQYGCVYDAGQTCFRSRMSFNGVEYSMTEKKVVKAYNRFTKKNDYFAIYVNNNPDSLPILFENSGGEGFTGFSMGFSESTGASLEETITYTETAEVEAAGSTVSGSIKASVGAAISQGTTDSIDFSFSYEGTKSCGAQLSTQTVFFLVKSAYYTKNNKGVVSKYPTITYNLFSYNNVNKHLEING